MVKIRGKTLCFQMDDLGGKPPYFRQTPSGWLEILCFYFNWFLWAKKWPSESTQGIPKGIIQIWDSFFCFANLAGQVTGYNTVMCRSGIRSLESKYHRSTSPFSAFVQVPTFTRLQAILPAVKKSIHEIHSHGTDNLYWKGWILQSPRFLLPSKLAVDSEIDRFNIYQCDIICNIVIQYSAKWLV